MDRVARLLLAVGTALVGLGGPASPVRAEGAAAVAEPPDAGGAEEGGAGPRTSDGDAEDGADETVRLPHRLDPASLGGVTDCPEHGSWSADLDGDGPPAEAVWYRCSPASAELDRPVDALVVRGGDGDIRAVYGNVADPTRSRLERVEPLALGDHDAEQLLVGEVFHGAGQHRAWCVLGARDDGLGCWERPRLDALARELLRDDETLCCSGWSLEVEGEGLRLEHPVYADDDPNCCPSRGRVVVELAADAGASQLRVRHRTRQPAEGPATSTTSPDAADEEGDEADETEAEGDGAGETDAAENEAGETDAKGDGADATDAEGDAESDDGWSHPAPRGDWQYQYLETVPGEPTRLAFELMAPACAEPRIRIETLSTTKRPDGTPEGGDGEPVVVHAVYARVDGAEPEAGCDDDTPERTRRELRLPAAERMVHVRVTHHAALRLEVAH